MMRVLLIDDCEFILKTAGRVLELQGFAVTKAISAKEALNRINHSGSLLDLYIIDLQMPEMDGTELVRLIRASGDATPCVAYTALDTGDMLDQLRSDGFNDIISKTDGPLKLGEWIKSFKAS